LDNSDNTAAHAKGITGCSVTEQNGYSLEHIGFAGTAASCSKPAQGYKTQRVSGIEQEPLHAFVAWVLESAGLSADAYRTVPMHRRLPACLRTLKVASVSEAWPLMRHPKSVEMAIDSLMIGVTEFFRDTAVFDALRQIIEANPAIHQKAFRVWSAGCSNGAELYSIAMQLAETGLIDRCVLVGTDCRESAIREAQAGLYSEVGMQSMDVLLRHRYLRKAGRQWRVVDSLRERIQWRSCNLLSGCETGPWDVILWRNMAIYLKLETVLQVWGALIKEMRPGGLLVVGKAERPPASAGLTWISRSIYQLQQWLT
jgi:chemotaxis protein methyltransferase CheR